MACKGIEKDPFLKIKENQEEKPSARLGLCKTSGKISTNIWDDMEAKTAL